jgi:hypothetical protein
MFVHDRNDLADLNNEDLVVVDLENLSSGEASGTEMFAGLDRVQNTHLVSGSLGQEDKRE